jgi:hypothetical protein
VSNFKQSKEKLKHFDPKYSLYSHDSNKATSGSLLDIEGFLLLVYFCVPLQSPLVCVIQSKDLSIVRVVIAASISVDWKGI